MEEIIRIEIMSRRRIFAFKSRSFSNSLSCVVHTHGRMLTTLDGIPRLRNLFQSTTYTGPPRLKYLFRYLRTSVLRSLCIHGDQGCIDITQELFTKFVDNDEKLSIAPHLRATVYSTVIKHGGTTEWEFLWSKYQETDATHKRKIMLGLTSSRQPWLLQRLLNNALKGSKIRKQDMLSAILGVSRNPVGRLQAWQFYKANFDKIVKCVGKDSTDYGIMLQRLTENFNEKYQLDEVKEFIKKHSSLFNNTRAGKKAVESIKTNIHWMKSHYDTIFNWLKQVNNEEY